MTSLPLPGAKEAELITKVGTGVLQGLRKARQLPDWPDTREALLELHEIMREWRKAAEATSRYARRLARIRNDPPASTITFGGPNMGMMNIASGYTKVVIGDSSAILNGRVSPLSKLRGSSKRRALRRGLRTIMSVYCPALLDQFEQAVAARAEWIQEYHKNFDRWFYGARSDAEVSQLLKEMEASKAGLVETERQLRNFIAANYPLPGATSNP